MSQSLPFKNIKVGFDLKKYIYPCNLCNFYHSLRRNFLREHLFRCTGCLLNRGSTIRWFLSQVNVHDKMLFPQQDSRFNQEIDKKTGYHTRSILCMPIRDHYHGEVCHLRRGILLADKGRHPHIFLIKNKACRIMVFFSK